MKKHARILVGLAFAGVLAWLLWKGRHSPDWQEFSWHGIWLATRSVRWPWIVGATALLCSSYVLRTLRWQILMTPKGRFSPVFSGTLIGFTGLTLLGRPGELLVRPYYIARKHGSHFSPQLAVWMLERAFDMGGVVLLVGLDLWLDPQVHALAHGGHYEGSIHRAGLLICGGVAVLLGGLSVFHLRTPHLRRRLAARRALRPLAAPVPRWEHFVETLTEGTGALGRPATMLVAVVYTLMIWWVIGGSIWAVVRGFPGLLPGFTFSEALVLMGIAAVGSVAQLPGVGGGFQAVLIGGLKIFGAPLGSAISATLLIWLINFYAVVPFGLALAAREGISWRGLERAAVATEAEEEAADVTS